MLKSYENLIEATKKHLYFETDPIHIKLILATVAAIYVPGEAIWLMIVGGSGSGKTEAIRMFDKYKFTHPLSDLSSNTFLSGAIKKKGDTKDPSLLHRIGNRGVLLLKDFTSLLSKRDDERKAILAQLREIYDGELSKETGTGKSLFWQGKLNAVGGVTTKYYEHSREIDAMGGRFVLYELPELSINSRKKLLRFISVNSGKEDLIRDELADFAIKAVDEVLESIPDELPNIDNDTVDVIIDLAEFVSRVRTPVGVTWNDKVSIVHNKESASRIFKQILKIGRMLMIINDGDLLDTDRDVLYKILLDSIPKNKRRIVFGLANQNVVSTSGLASIVNLPPDVVRSELDKLEAHGIVSRTGTGDGGALWVLEGDGRAILNKVDESVIDVNNSIIQVDNKNVTKTVDEYVDPTYKKENDEDLENQFLNF